MTDEERDVPAVRQAMKQLTQYINASEQETQRLTQAEAHLGGRVAMLTSSLSGAERQVLESREEVRRLTSRERELQASLREMTSRAERGDEALRRRAEDAEERAAVYGTQNEELTDKAELGERLSGAAQKMVDAIERLPTKMEEATPIRTAPSAIPFYDTYEWQAVADAKILLLRAMGRPTEERREDGDGEEVGASASGE